MKNGKPEITFISTCETITAYGVRLLSSILRQEGYPTKIIFTPYILEKESDSSIDKLASEIENICKNSSILGFSLFSCHLPFVSKLSKQLKNRLNIPIIWGGKHSTVQPRDAIGYADMVCVGEGETSLKMLLQAIEQGKDYNKGKTTILLMGYGQ